MERIENPWHAEMCRGSKPEVRHCAECGCDIRETDYCEYDKYDDEKVYCGDCAPVGYCEVCCKPLYADDDYEVDPFNEKKLYCAECVGF